MANQWQDDWGLPRNTSLAQFSRVLDQTFDQMPDGDSEPDPDLDALDELEAIDDPSRYNFQRDAIDWLGGAA